MASVAPVHGPPAAQGYQQAVVTTQPYMGYNQAPPQPLHVPPQGPPAMVYNPQHIPMMANTTSTTVVVNQGTVGHGERNWSSGICDCCEDVGSCCLAFWCWECFLCMLEGRMGECACGAFWCGPVANVAMRTRARSKLNIQGTVIGDICCVMWCPCCAMTQVYREVDKFPIK